MSKESVARLKKWALGVYNNPDMAWVDKHEILVEEWHNILDYGSWSENCFAHDILDDLIELAHKEAYGENDA